MTNAVHPCMTLATLLLLAGCSDGGGGGAPPPPAAAAPVFSSAGSASTPENASGVVYTAAASDANGDAVTFSISGGADAARFSITSGGALSFVLAPDFEAPADAGGDNVYDVTLRASDGALSSTLALQVTVTDVAGGFRVTRIATGFNQPLFVTGRGDGTDRLLVMERPGRIMIFDRASGTTLATPFLDISASISTAGEFGLLGMALAPDFSASGAFYVYASNVSGDSEIRRFTMDAIAPDQADASSEDVILRFSQPDTNHNAGWIGFGPDDFLYIASGDGGGGNDPFATGQDSSDLLAAMLRIDPSSDGFPGDPLRDYAIPSGNPFATGGGAPEVYAIGLRNPFRAGFDSVTGDLYIGDVGQGAIEEISLIRPGDAGLNFGWPILEGTRVNQSGSTTGFTPPVAEYDHGLGRSVTGGTVYRGPGEGLQGRYVFGDFITGAIFSIAAADVVQGQTIGAAALRNDTAAFQPDAGTIDRPTSFSIDDAGRLYITDIDGELFEVVPE